MVYPETHDYTLPNQINILQIRIGIKYSGCMIKYLHEVAGIDGIP